MSRKALNITFWVVFVWILFSFSLALDYSYLIYEDVFRSMDSFKSFLLFDGMLSLVFTFFVINYFFWRKYWGALISTAVLFVIHTVYLWYTYKYYVGEDLFENHDRLILISEFSFILDGLILFLSSTRKRKWLRIYGLVLLVLSILTFLVNQTSILSLTGEGNFNELMNYLYPLAAFLFLINLQEEKNDQRNENNEHLIDN